MDIVEKLRGRSEYERHLGVELIYLYHMDVENICKEIERLREALKEAHHQLDYWQKMALLKTSEPALQQKETE